ncbi:MAG: M23 family metallopeptidase [Pyrinomonadaceae bacterium]
MSKFNKIIAKILLVFYLIFLHFILIVFIYEKFSLWTADFSRLNPDSVPEQEDKNRDQTPIPLPSFSETVLPTPTPETISTPAVEYPAEQLMIPVKGIRRDQLQDIYNEARSENRVHKAIDIMAAQGTPVVAAADGEIAKFFDSQLGGITIYQYSTNKKLVYYYAHLQRREDQIQEKQFVKRGTVIGYVGDTGNAGAGNFHLHFSIYEIEKPERYWEGNNLNPYPLLKNGIEVN